MPAETPPSALPDLVGRELAGRYRIEAPLGTGGFGVVYRAWDRKSERGVALKVLRSELASNHLFQRRFKREAKALMAVDHPNIVSVTDYGVADGVPYLTMELLEGRGLDREIKEDGPIAEARARVVFSQLLTGIAYMHEHGLVHRDLKPGNVFVQQLPEGRECIKLLDFGLAKFLEGEGGDGDHTILTRTGQVFGTPAFMPPEQLGGGTVDQRADLYSAAVVLFRMLSGRRPFEGEPHEVLRKVLAEPPPTLASLDPDVEVQADLEGWFQRSLAKDPQERYENVAASLAALDAVPTPWLRNTNDVTTRAVAETLDSADLVSVASEPSPALVQLAAQRGSSSGVGLLSRVVRRVLLASAKLVSAVSVLVIAAAAVAIYALSDGQRNSLMSLLRGRPGETRAPAAAEVSPPPSISAGMRGVSEAAATDVGERRGSSDQAATPAIDGAPGGTPDSVEPVPSGVGQGALGPAPMRAETQTADPAQIAGERQPQGDPPGEPSLQPAPGSAGDAQSVTVVGALADAPPAARDVELAQAPPAAEPLRSSDEESDVEEVYDDSDDPQEILEEPASPLADDDSAQDAPGSSDQRRPRARDPFARGTPRSLVVIRKRLARGYKGTEHMVTMLRRFNRQHPQDARGHLLLARLYMNRHWYSDVVHQYQFAYRCDPAARGYRPMLRDLLKLVSEDSAHRQAAQVVREVYGSEAIAAVERSRQTADLTKVKRRLSRLQRALGGGA